MPSRPSPRSLRPMTREQKLWLAGTIVLFVVFTGIGWYFTVARAIAKSVRDSRATIESEFTETKQELIGDEDVSEKTKEIGDRIKIFFQNTKQHLENKQKAEQAILDNVKEEWKHSSQK